MPHAHVVAAAIVAALFANSGCSSLPPAADLERYGAQPDLPAPQDSTFPTVNIAPARGWPEGGQPTPTAELAVEAYACGLAHPRWLHLLPDGDVLVANTDAPQRSEDHKGLRGWIMKRVMKRAGSGTPSADRIRLLRDADLDGVAETKSSFLAGLHSPFGMALVGETLYVANTDALLRFAYREGATSIDAAGTRVAALPGGALNHHWTKSLLASRDGKRLYVGVGSNSNIAENGIDKEDQRAAILEIDAASGATRVFASGLRNPVGMGWQPQTGELWVAVNERDELGDDLVPDYALRAHTASLGLVFGAGDAMPPRYREGAFVGQHGSWNRSVPSGYKVVFVRFEAGKPVGSPEEVLGGFLDADGKAYGRPAGVAIDRAGALLVADDVGGCVWRVSADEAP